MCTQNLNLKTKKELGEIAKAKNIKVSQSWLKQDIIDAIIVGEKEKKSTAPIPSKTPRRGEY